MGSVGEAEIPKAETRALLAKRNAEEQARPRLARSRFHLGIGSTVPRPRRRS